MKKMYLKVVLLASLVAGACSCDSDATEKGGFSVTGVSEAPVWEVDWTSDQQRPDWTQPDASAYENWTIVMVQIEEALQPYVTDDDLMALFVNGELRGMASPAVAKGDSQAGSTKFVMKVYGNESGNETVNMSLKYYNSRLKHMFTLSDDITLSSDVTTGTDEDYIPPFTMGSEKYPMMKTVDVETILTLLGIEPESGMIAAFVGGECRGVATVESYGSSKLIIHGRTQGEKIMLKYYDEVTKTVFTISDAVKM
jgi:hypothetical protein